MIGAPSPAGDTGGGHAAGAGLSAGGDDVSGAGDESGGGAPGVSAGGPGLGSSAGSSTGSASTVKCDTAVAALSTSSHSVTLSVCGPIARSGGDMRHLPSSSAVTE